MKLFENGVGRPSNEIRNKRKLFIIGIGAIVMLFVFVCLISINYIYDNLKASVSKDVIKDNKIYLDAKIDDTWYVNYDLSDKYVKSVGKIKRNIYYYKWNSKTKKYEKITKNSAGKELKTNLLMYKNDSIIDGKTSIRWYYVIEGKTYYTKTYSIKNKKEIKVTDSYIEKVNSKYDNSEGEKKEKSDEITKEKSKITYEDKNLVKKSTLITTANYQLSLEKFEKLQKSEKQKIIDDIKIKYIFTATHSASSKSTKTTSKKIIIKGPDDKTGAICETLAKLTNSVCISRTKFDYSTPNSVPYENSLYQQFIVKMIDELKPSLLLDIHGILDKSNYNAGFYIGTFEEQSLVQKDRCLLQKRFATALLKNIPKTKVGMYKSKTCNYSNMSKKVINVGGYLHGGTVVQSAYKRTKYKNHSSLQIEISETNRNKENIPKTINAIYSFVTEYKKEN